MAEWRESRLWMELAHQGAFKPQSHRQKEHLEEHTQPIEAHSVDLCWCDIQQHTWTIEGREQTLLGRQNTCHGAADPCPLTLVKPHPPSLALSFLICKTRICENALMPWVAQWGLGGGHF